MNLLNAIKLLVVIVVLATTFETHAKSNMSEGKTRAATQAKAQYGGKVLSVRESKSGGQTYYKVKLLLDSGRIKIVEVKRR